MNVGDVVYIMFNSGRLYGKVIEVEPTVVLIRFNRRSTLWADRSQVYLMDAP